MLLKLSVYLKTYTFIDNKRLQEYYLSVDRLEREGGHEEWLQDLEDVTKRLVQVRTGYYCLPGKEEASLKLITKKDKKEKGKSIAV